MNAFERYHANIREAEEEARFEMIWVAFSMAALLCVGGLIGYLRHMDDAAVSRDTTVPSVSRVTR